MKGMKQSATKDAKNFYIGYLKKTFETEKPLACLLKTASGYYLYDTGTNKILGCREQVFEFLNDLFLKDVNQAAGDFISKYGETESLSPAAKCRSKIWIKEKEKYPTPSTREN